MDCACTTPTRWSFAEALEFLQDQKSWHTSAAPVGARTETSSASDEQCMVDYQQGDSRSFRILYFRYREKLHRYLLRLAERSSEAEELFQEVWVAVIKGRERYEPSASFASWLFSIAHRRAADRWRTLGRHAPDWQSQCDDGADFEHPAPATTTPERLAHSRELGLALLQAISSLPAPQREAFLMKADGDLSLDDIAIATQVSRETVKSRLRYAQRRLRDALDAWR